MAWEIYNARESFPIYAQQWDELNQQMFQGHPLLDSRFVGPLIGNFGHSKLVLAVEYDNVNKAKSMVILEYMGKKIWRTFLPSQAQIGPCLLKNTSTLKNLACQLLPSAWVIDLLCEDECYSLEQNTIDEKALKKQAHATTMNVELSKGFEGYWSERPRSLRKNIKRYYNKTTKDGRRLNLKIHSKPEDINVAVADYASLESKGWKGRSGTAIDISTPQGVFYQTILSLFAERNEATVYELYLDEKLVSSRLTINNGSMLVVLKTTFDEDYSRYAPGRLQLHLLLKSIFEENKVTVIEFYTNASKDQLQWKTTSRSINHTSWYRFPLLKSLATAKQKLTKQ